MKCDKTGQAKASRVPWLIGLSLVLMLFALHARAQAASDARPADLKISSDIYQTFYLNNVNDQHDANDIVQDLRNLLPKSRIYLVAAPGVISMHGPVDDVEQAKRIVADLDRARKVYRLTYTITDSENGKRVNAQHYSLIAISGEKAEMKQGSRIPVVTGSTEAAATPSTQVQYIDVGLNITAWLDGNQDGLRLHSKIEQSSPSEEKSGVGAQDPVVRQTLLESMSVVVQGKPLVLGALDVPGTTRHQEIEVVSEIVR